MKPWGQDFFLKVEHCFRGVLEIFRQTPPSLYRGVSQWDMHYTVYVAVVLLLLKMSPNTKLRGSLPKGVPLDFGLEKTFAS